MSQIQILGGPNYLSNDKFDNGQDSQQIVFPKIEQIDDPIDEVHQPLNSPIKDKNQIRIFHKSRASVIQPTIQKRLTEHTMNITRHNVSKSNSLTNLQIKGKNQGNRNQHRSVSVIQPSNLKDYEMAEKTVQTIPRQRQY